MSLGVLWPVKGELTPDVSLGAQRCPTRVLLEDCSKLLKQKNNQGAATAPVYNQEILLQM